MRKILENIRKEITQIGEQGINANNIDVLYKLVDIEKDIKKIESMDRGGDSMRYRDYGEYGNYGRYNERGGNRSYNERGGGNYGRYGHDERMYQHLDRIMEGADEYQYGRDRYREGGAVGRMEDGLEKLMYALCAFVESTFDFAETPEEKEIIRKHIQKMKGM